MWDLGCPLTISFLLSSFPFCASVGHWLYLIRNGLGLLALCRFSNWSWFPFCYLKTILKVFNLSFCNFYRHSFIGVEKLPPTRWYLSWMLNILPHFSHSVSLSPFSALWMSHTGVQYVFDTTLAAGFSILESQKEFIQRYRRRHHDSHALPMFTSSCPGKTTFLLTLSAPPCSPLPLLFFFPTCQTDFSATELPSIHTFSLHFHVFCLLFSPFLRLLPVRSLYACCVLNRERPGLVLEAKIAAESWWGKIESFSLTTPFMRNRTPQLSWLFCFVFLNT